MSTKYKVKVKLAAVKAETLLAAQNAIRRHLDDQEGVEAVISFTVDESADQAGTVEELVEKIEASLANQRGVEAETTVTKTRKVEPIAGWASSPMGRAEVSLNPPAPSAA